MTHIVYLNPKQSKIDFMAPRTKKHKISISEYVQIFITYLEYKGAVIFQSNTFTIRQCQQFVIIHYGIHIFHPGIYVAVETNAASLLYIVPEKRMRSNGGTDESNLNDNILNDVAT